MKKKYFGIYTLFFDFISAVSSWGLFNYFRKTYIEKYDFEVNDKLVISTFLYHYFGYYFTPFLEITGTFIKNTDLKK